MATRRIRNPQDFVGGLVLVALAAVAFWATRELPGSRGLTFGPGTAPRLFAGLLAFTGAVVTILGVVTPGPSLARYVLRGPLMIFASVCVFAAAVKPLGLVLATFVTVLVASAASAETRWREAVVWAATLSVFCALLFSYGLGLPLALWPKL
ncbi:MAG: tripartite tricarboxylate transporter TctB family protein [Vicinamibacteria bacterium]|jgi:putative tricarboxylic transport membrane protein